MPHRNRRDEAGAAAPSYVVILSVVAVAMAGIALIASGDSGGDLEPVAQPSSTVSVTESQSVAPVPSMSPKPVVRGEVSVEVYNTSSIKKLAARTATNLSVLGWQVLGTDNWPGSVPAPTIYYGPRLEEAAKLLAEDLGIRRIRPFTDPMKPDRLTVILDRTYVAP